MKQTQGSCAGAPTACLYCYLKLAVGCRSRGPPVRRLDSLLYLAMTAVLWVASVLSLEQRKCCNACQELSFIFTSRFLWNQISATLPGYNRLACGSWCKGCSLPILQWQVDILLIILPWEHFLWGAFLNLEHDLFLLLSLPVCFSIAISFVGLR